MQLILDVPSQIEAYKISTFAQLQGLCTKFKLLDGKKEVKFNEKKERLRKAPVKINRES